MPSPNWPRKWLKPGAQPGHVKLVLPELSLLDDDHVISTADAKIEHSGRAIAFAIDQARRSRSPRTIGEQLELALALTLHRYFDLGQWPEPPVTTDTWQDIRSKAETFQVHLQ